LNQNLRIRLIVRKALAWSVHAFTATGALLGLLALMAIFRHEWRGAIAWMILAMFVDGFDGMLARWAEVDTYAPGLDGALLDNILDYINYVLVPALFLIEAESILPTQFRMAAAFTILLTSAYQFTQSDAKTEDNYFQGFPSYWNVMVLYMLVMKLNPWVNLAFLVMFNILVFVPVKYIYPSRNSIMKRLTSILTYLYGIVGVWAAMQYPNVPAWAIWATYVYVVYYAALSLWPKGKFLENA